MSKKSHAKHEHAQHHDHANQHIDQGTEPIPQSFAERHKRTVWILAIGFAIIAPLFFAALTLLGLFR